MPDRTFQSVNSIYQYPSMDSYIGVHDPYCQCTVMDTIYKKDDGKFEMKNLLGLGLEGHMLGSNIRAGSSHGKQSRDPTVT